MWYFNRCASLVIECNSLAMGANNAYQLQRDPIVFRFARKAIGDRLKGFAAAGTRVQRR